MTGRFWKLLAPQKCLYCNEPTDDPDGAVCDRCLPEEERLLNARCPVCGLAAGECVCSDRDDYAFLFYYGCKSVRNATARIKYANNDIAVRHMARLLAEKLKDGRFDAVFFVPRSKKAKRKYGFDQAELLAGAVAELLGLPVCAALFRKSESKPQKLLSAAQRRKNIRDTFSVHEDMVGGIRSALLIDDVITTGATVTECARILRGAGIRTVRCACIAKTPKKHPV